MIRREVVELVPANHMQIGDVLRHNSRDYVVRNVVIDKAYERRYVFDMILKVPPQAQVPGQRPPPPPPAQNITAPEGGKVNRVRVLWEHPARKPAKKPVKKKVGVKKVKKDVDEAFFKSLYEEAK